jgi:hypothetical protein
MGSSKRAAGSTPIGLDAKHGISTPLGMTSLVTLAREAERLGVRRVLLLPFLLGTV